MAVVYAWGSGSSGQLGTRDDLDYAVPVKVDLEVRACLYPRVEATIASDQAAFVGITTGGSHTAGWTTSGLLFTWGDGSRDQLGHATSSSPSLIPQPADSLPPIDLACCGWWHTVAVSQASGRSTPGDRQATQVFAWGYGHASNHSALPSPPPDPPGSPPANVPLMSFPNSVRITSLSCGWKHSLMATQDGRVFAWGKGRHGELAMGLHSTDAAVPTLVEALSRQTIRNVFCGWQHSVFLTADGNVWTCGSNKHGQLGVLPQVKTRAFEPQRVQLEEPMADVSVGWHHVVCLGRSGAVYAWGKGDMGQLGIGTFESRSQPEMLPDFADSASAVVQVACGSEHTLFVTANGQVYSCGWGEHGNLGHGNTDNVAAPAKVAYFYSHDLRVDRCVAGGAVSIAITH